MSPIANDGAGYGTAEDRRLSPRDREAARRLLSILRVHCLGASGAHDVADLALWLNVSERKVRALVTHLRRRGHPILATPDTGYFWPRGREEAEHTVAFLTARLRSTYEVRAGIVRGLDDLFGGDEGDEQLELAA